MLLDWLISFSMAFSGQAVITYAAVRMLDSRRPGILWAIALVGCMVTACTNSLPVAPDIQALWSIVNLAVSIATYVAFSRLSLPRALFIVAVIMVVTLVAEFAAVAVMLLGLGVNVTAGPAFARAHPGAYLFLIVTHTLLLAALFYLARLLMRGLAGGSPGKLRTSMLLFPVSHAVLLLTAIEVVRVMAAGDESVLVLGAVLALLVASAYFVFYIAMRKAAEQELADARLTAVREAGELALEHARSVVDQSRRVAKLRHDFRNQVQTIELLVEGGERERAKVLLAELLAKVERESERDEAGEDAR